MKKKIVAGLLSLALMATVGVTALAATVHYNDSSVTGKSAAWQAWEANWDTLANDYTQVAITPGEDESELNFAWYSEKTDAEATPVVHFGTDGSMRTFRGVSGLVDTSLTNGKAYEYNRVKVTGIRPGTNYTYTVEKNGVETKEEAFYARDTKETKILYVGDPQVGASKGQPQNGEELKADKGAANTAARNDGFAWNRTLETAFAQNPDINFILSAGDQVNKTGKAKEEEYAGFLAAQALKTVPIAPTIGNHDSLNADYAYHFYTPNPTENGKTQAGGDYYYSYGDGLFIMLNTNNYNVAEHEATIKAAVASDPGATWRVVTIHQDIYGSGLDHSDTDGMILRTQLTPVFDKYDIDVVLQGHDHSYTRSKLLYGDGKAHAGYEFRLNEEGTDYDWEHAYNIADGTKIPLNPEEGDEQGAALLAAFQKDNLCYTIENTNGNVVKNPKGILYMSANTASGSKCYELIENQQDYIAARSQDWLPGYSVITMTKDSFKIETYQIQEDGQTQLLDDAFTIVKTK